MADKEPRGCRISFYSIRLRVPQFTIFEQIVKRVGVGLTSSLLALDARLR